MTDVSEDLRLGVSEEYTLVVTLGATAELRADTVFGALRFVVCPSPAPRSRNPVVPLTHGPRGCMGATVNGRGLETFSQLVAFTQSSGTYRIDNVPLTIDDGPRFAWRGASCLAPLKPQPTREAPN